MPPATSTIPLLPISLMSFSIVIVIIIFLFNDVSCFFFPQCVRWAGGGGSSVVYVLSQPGLNFRTCQRSFRWPIGTLLPVSITGCNWMTASQLFWFVSWSSASLTSESIVSCRLSQFSSIAGQVRAFAIWSTVTVSFDMEIF